MKIKKYLVLVVLLGVRNKMNRQELRKWKKEDLIDLLTLRNDDAKIYAEEITWLRKDLKERKK